MDQYAHPDEYKSIPVLEVGRRVSVGSDVDKDIGYNDFDRIGINAKNPPLADAATTRLYREVEPSVVRIERADGATGTGYVANNDTIVTAAHVLTAGHMFGNAFSANGTRDVDIITADGTTLHGRSDINSIDKEHDVALIRILDNANLNLPALVINDDTSPIPGMPAWSLGHPLGLAETYISPNNYFATKTGYDATTDLRRAEFRTGQ